MSDLGSLRERIDTLDTTLVNLLNERAQVSLNIGAAKRKATTTSTEYVYDLTTSLSPFSLPFLIPNEELQQQQDFNNDTNYTYSDSSSKELHVYMPGREKEVYKKVEYIYNY